MEYTYIEGDVGNIVRRFNESPVVSLDLETSGLNPIDSRILLMQIGFQTHEYVINVHTADVKPLLPFLSSPKWIKIIHNADFEQKFIQYYYDTFIRGVYDTMLAEQVLTSNKIQKSLADVVDKYLGIKLDKKQQTSFIGMKPGQMFSDEQLSYAAKDVSDIMFQIRAQQMEKLKEEELWNIAKLEFDVVGVVAAMENEGLPINIQGWRQKLTDYHTKEQQHAQRLHELIYDAEESSLNEQLGLFERRAMNFKSPKQVKEALNSLGIDVDATNEQVLAQLDEPVAKELLAYRGVVKVIDSYGESLLDKIHPFTNRLHPDFKQLGTETGRMSCREPNVQQIPPEFRTMIGFVDNYVIVGADYSQMELRIIAQLSGDKKFIEAFHIGADPHKGTAAIMFNVALEDVTYEQRYTAKTINFGLAYGMGDDKLMRELNKELEKKITFSQAKALAEQYRKTYSTTVNWFARMGNVALNRGYSITLGGRKRFFTKPSGVLDEETLRKQLGAIRRAGGNAPIQGTNADITKMAMIDIHEELLAYGYKARIINQVHDEIVMLAHKSQAEAIKIMLVDCMRNAAERLITEVPVVVDGYISENWNKK